MVHQSSNRATPEGAVASFFVFLLLVGWSFVAHAIFTDTRTDWSNFFGSDGYLVPYTSDGQPVRDEETSSDTSNGGAAVTPSHTDLASGSPGADPGLFETSLYGYYNGGTPYDPNDPSTLEDDYIMFRMRLAGDPSTNSTDLKSAHWNVLVDIDNDGYKEFWVDVNGPFASGNNKDDQLQILYDDGTTQNITDPNGARVEEFTANNFEDPGNFSHTRVVATTDGTGDFLLDIQVPLTAFNDLSGNQVVLPDSPIAFVFSTSTSNTNPLQKDWMQELDPDGGTFNLTDPIIFGDTVTADGTARVRFTDSSDQEAAFYYAGDDIFVTVTDVFANSDPNAVEMVTITVKNPANGDLELITLTETGPNSSIFTNNGGADTPDASSSPNAYIGSVKTSKTTVAETWTATYDATGSNWLLSGSLSGVQTAMAVGGVEYTSDNGEVTFTILESGAPANGDVITFLTFAADPLTSSGTPGAVDDGDIQVAGGDVLTVEHLGGNGEIVDDAVDIFSAGEPVVQFGRGTGLPNDLFFLDGDLALSDQLFVTVTHASANTNPSVAETVTVTLTSPTGDMETLTLTETGPDTGVFRNTTGLDAKISDGTVTGGDGLWEDVDSAVVTATYTFGGTDFTGTASFFTTLAGTVRFTNAAGTQNVTSYNTADAIFLKLSDNNLTTCSSVPFTVTVSSATTGDSETVTMTETSAGSGIFVNRVADLVTTASSAVVTSSSSAFITDGVMAGDTFVIGTGPDVGNYSVSSVDSETQITLSSTLSTSNTGVVFTARPVLVVETGGTPVANDGQLEAANNETLTVTYVDCDDGDLDPSNDAKIDTAIAIFAATFAFIEEFTVTGSTSHAVVQWRTSFELGTVGFDLLRFDDVDQQYHKLNKRLLPGLLHSRRGGAYRFIDRGAKAGETYTYLLVEKEADGGEIRHGPYTVTVSYTTGVSLRVLGGHALGLNFTRVERAPSKAERARGQARRVARRAARKARSSRIGTAVKMLVTEPGIHYVDAAQIGPYLGLPEKRVKTLMRRNRLAIYNRGQRVATHFSKVRGGLYFYGEAAESVYTDSNVYWLRRGDALPMKRGGARYPRSVSTLQHHVATVHSEGNQYTLAHLFDDPDADYWMWDFLFPGFGFDSKSFNIAIADPTSVDDSAMLTVRLHGGNETPAPLDHHAVISFNGVSVGDVQWDGIGGHTATFPIPATLLEHGDNELQVRGVLEDGVPYSVFYVNDFDVTYSRRNRARENRLELGVDKQAVVTIEGFDRPEILVFDVTDTARPKWLKRIRVEAVGDTYRVSLRVPRAHQIATLLPEAALLPVALLADTASRLKHPGNQGSYLIVTTSDMVETAQRLADYRARQGHSALVVDIEDIYDEFSDGLKDPDAIWSFLAHAYRRWRVPPRYVVLAGDGSHDYKDYLGFGDSIVPALLTPTPHGLFPSDNLYGDVVGNDWVSEIAIGRLPVINATELDAVIDKIMSYEAARGAWTERVTLAADEGDEAGNFVADSEVVGARLPSEYTVDRIYLDRMSTPDARAELFGNLADGRAYLNFIGHGGITGVGNTGLLNLADVAGLTNGPRLPVVTAVSCLVNQFGLPGFDAIGEQLVTHPQGGAVAVWSATGLSLNRSARVLDIAFYEAIFSDGESVLGDAILNAQRRYARFGGPRYILDIYSLLGDPALLLK